MRYLCFYLLLMALLSVNGQNAPERVGERKGFFLGVAAGPSLIRLKTASQPAETELSLSFPNFKLGYMIRPQLALALSLPGTVYRYSAQGRVRDRGFEAILPSVQYWPSKRWWILAGAGLGMDAPAFYDIKDETERSFYFGAAAIAATGYEVWQGRRFVLDVQLRVHTGNVRITEKRQGTALSLMLGLSGY
ncbi:MAG: hypothetical protein EAZ89_07185 [Bacteroidetes bacterium]|nr:MAG: hypothetical protein EAZ89_07185 [Bacteroidota bacterium]